MTPILGTIIDGKIVPDFPLDWLNGKRVVIEPVTQPTLEMMTEDEQGDDPESIARWVATFDAIPPASTSPLDDPAVVAWREAMRRHNLEAVRKQMQRASE